MFPEACFSGIFQFSIFLTVGEMAPTLKGQLSGVALGVIHGGPAKPFKVLLSVSFSVYILLLKELEWCLCCSQLNSDADAL